MEERLLETPRGAVRVRPVREEDAEAYRELRLEGLRLHPEAFGSDFESSSAHPLEYWRERMKRGAAGEQGVTLVAEAGAQLVGTTTLLRNEHRNTRHGGNIFGVYVRGAWRGVGVADALLEGCLAQARALELRLVKLGVGAHNASATRLYLRHGFAVYGVEPEALRVGGRAIDELLLVCRLAS